MSAYQAYMDAANSVELSEHYQSLVQNGSLYIEDITDETLKEQIRLYQDYYEKALQAADGVEELNNQLAELTKQKFDKSVDNLPTFSSSGFSCTR